MGSEIRLVGESDAEPIQAIYAPIVRDTAISFELEPPSVAEMARRVRETLARWPWLVCERDGELLGYAYASRHRERAAYQWSLDVWVYTRPDARRGGVGRALYGSLLTILALQGYHGAYAGITLPNAASVGLHEAVGFVPVGVYRGVGYKLGAWHDVGWWQRVLLPRLAGPEPPVALPSVRGAAGFAEALASGRRQLRIARHRSRLPASRLRPISRAGPPPSASPLPGPLVARRRVDLCCSAFAGHDIEHTTRRGAAMRASWP